ncbi:peptide-methionine (S)-S-oxide reductase [Meiothermus sp. QL-1]|nr:peptide-methionine (S)-S-oxide reductase [Meiothermus sp. QL-1]
MCSGLPRRAWAGFRLSGVETATLGGGCFWCLEAVFEEVAGVTRVVPGYAGGHLPNPTYAQVCTQETGHAEVVQLTFDPGVVSYRELLEIFFAVHDPTTKDRQGADVGPQYRSIILYHSPAQRTVAEAVIREQERFWGRPIVTELVPFEVFYPAEAYHQGYFRRNPEQPYCRYVIAPKLAKFRRQFAQYLSNKGGKTA